MAARVLVTGALGNVGQHVVRACLAGGFDVRAAGAAEKVQQQWPSAQACALDFTQPTTWTAALQDVDHVFLLRPPPLGNMATTLIPFVDAAYAAGVKHIVFLSVAGADKKSWVPHRKVEDHLQHTGTAWTILRPGFFAQNLGDAYRQDIVEDDRLFVPAGQGRVAFLDVADVGDVVCTILADHAAHRGRAYLLAGPEAVTFGELAQRLSAALGRTVVYRPASIPGYVWHLWRRRRLPWMQVMVQTVLHVGLRSGEAQDTDDTQRMLLGREATPITGYLTRSAHLWDRNVRRG